MLRHYHNQFVMPLMLFALVIVQYSCKEKKRKEHTEYQKQAMATAVDLSTLLKPTNAFVVSSIPVTTIQNNEQSIEIDAVGSIGYDTRQAGIISARYAGRIEKMFVRYRFQKVAKGEKIMDIYSPELMTAQQDFLFILKNDAANTSLLNAAKQRLLLLGITASQIAAIMNNGKPSFTVSVYSNYAGHIHETTGSAMASTPGAMKDAPLTTDELSLKQGMYIQKGQSLFTVYNTDRAWVVLNLFAGTQSLVKVGNAITITPETTPNKKFRGTINFIEPFLRQGSKTITARVNFDNSLLQLPVGSQVNATIFSSNNDAAWLPTSAVVSLGLDKVVFIKQTNGFKAHKVMTGLSYKNKIQVVNGIAAKDSVAQNAAYLMDSEGFIKVNE